ncbi:cell division protein ZapA [bacterium BFN5]|nr:cell division protein ZapA [bacterium BFN5]QJW46174.1 cell division protein ZapA [bacterium BFN5]
MESKNRVTVEIFGEVYALKGDIEAERVMKLAAMVDKRMRTIAKSNSQLSSLKIAVLAALNLADEYLLLEKDYNQLVEMLKEK